MFEVDRLRFITSDISTGPRPSPGKRKQGERKEGEAQKGGSAKRGAKLTP
jgi:hypothetical protein